MKIGNLKNVRILILAILVFMLYSTDIFAASDNITIKLNSHKDMGSVSGVQFTLYKIGEVKEDTGIPVFDSRYNITEPPETAEDMREIVSGLKGTNKGTPVMTGMTSSDGTLSFNVDSGIYYIEAPENDYGVIEPAVVWLPTYDFKMSAADHSAMIVPKAEPNKAEPAEPNGDVFGETAEPDDTVTDDGIDKNTDTEDVLGEEGYPDSGDGESSKTGDASKILSYIGLSSLSILMILLILKKRRGAQNAK